MKQNSGTRGESFGLPAGLAARPTAQPGLNFAGRSFHSVSIAKFFKCKTVCGARSVIYISMVAPKKTFGNRWYSVSRIRRRTERQTRARRQIFLSVKRILTICIG
jgi:hypothetical protein